MSKSEAPSLRPKTPIYKKWWFWGLLLVLLVPYYLVMPKETEADRAKTVVMNGIGGSVYQVEKFIKKQLKDPDSFKAYKWGPVSTTEDGAFTVWVDFGAKNGFGGMVRETWTFDLDKTGTVTGIVDSNLKVIYPIAE